MATATLPKLKAKRFWTYDEMLAELPETNVATGLWGGEIAEYWIVDPESRAIEVFPLIKGVYQLHSKGRETTPAKSRRLSGFKISFNNLRA